MENITIGDIIFSLIASSLLTVYLWVALKCLRSLGIIKWRKRAKNKKSPTIAKDVKSYSVWDIISMEDDNEQIIDE